MTPNYLEFDFVNATVSIKDGVSAPKELYSEVETILWLTEFKELLKFASSERSGTWTHMRRVFETNGLNRSEDSLQNYVSVH